MIMNYDYDLRLPRDSVELVVVLDHDGAAAVEEEDGDIFIIS